MCRTRRTPGKAVKPNNRELGTCYYPEHWPEDLWQTDAEQMINLGLKWVRIGEFSWSRLEPKENEEKEKNKCKNYVLAKKYIDLEELNEDNGKTIYFDKNLDPTQYDIRRNYTKEENEMNPMQFKTFLMGRLLC